MTLGLRQGELLALVWSDVDLDRCLLTVSGTITWLNGRPYVGRPKSEPGRRTVSIPAQVAAVLGAWKATQDTEREAAGEAWLDNNLVFAAPEGRPRRGDVQTHRFRLLCESYELPSIRFHDLRRFAAVLLVTSSGGDVMSAGARPWALAQISACRRRVWLPPAGDRSSPGGRRGGRAVDGRSHGRLS